jgi:hypothetical protein
MIEPTSVDEIQHALRVGSKNKNEPISLRLANFPQYFTEKIGCLAIFNQSINADGIKHLLIKNNLPFESNEEANEWIIRCVENAFLQVEITDDQIFYYPDKDAVLFFEHELTEDVKCKYHQYADSVYFEWLIGITAQLDIGLPDDEKAQRLLLIGPNGILDKLIHLPQARGIFISAMNVATSWQNHLYELKLFDEATGIVNAICFALTREGNRQFAESLLIRSISATKGLPNLVSRVNLATLLREESKLDLALSIYKKTILELIKARAYTQLVVVFF